jgi:prepilin-type N-terminal cleavage/methylation domain-containing protein
MSKESQKGQKTKLGHAQRRGVSLVELLIVISVATVIVGICVTTIHVLLRSERDQSRAVRTAVTLSRLTEVFRDDVHATSNAEIVSHEAQPSRLTLSDADGRQIGYSADGHLLQRVETARGAEIHRDTFHFPSGSTMRFERDESPRLVRMIIDVAAALPHEMPEGRTRSAPPRTLLIEALPDRDHRYAGRKP